MDLQQIQAAMDRAKADPEYFHALLFGGAAGASSELAALPGRVQSADFFRWLAGSIAVSCDGTYTCCCTSGTCGDTCGGSTCSVTCSGESCGSTCGDSCGYTTNISRFGQVSRPMFGG